MIEKALYSLRPNAKVAINGNSLDSIEWHPDNTDSRPTDDEIQAEISRLQIEYDAKAYARSRAAKYPPITDYLDGVVKGDQAQIDAYIAACQAVKDKYPKPE